MNIKKIEFVYLRIIAVLYLIGAILHVMDIFDLRLMFSEMNLIWKTWTIYLLVFDFLVFWFLGKIIL